MRKIDWGKVNLIYETVMICLVIISLVTIFMNQDSGSVHIHTVIWLIFLIDVTVRFLRAAVKWRYIRDNPFDIVTVIPLEDTFILARFARFIKLFRYKNIVKRYVERIKDFVRKIGFFRVTLIAIIFNFLMISYVIIFHQVDLTGSFLWVWSNFLKFNYESNLRGLIVLSVIIKIIGIIYLGIFVSKVSEFLRATYIKYRKVRETE